MEIIEHNDSKIKAITIWQPWASLLASGTKKYETRSWATNYRGPILIHSARKTPESTFRAFEMDRYNRPELFNAVWKTFNCTAHNLPTGRIIATAELVACHMIHENTGSTGQIYILPGGDTSEPIYLCDLGDEQYLGDWTPGRYAWEFKNMQVLERPIPEKGGQKLWNYSLPPRQEIKRHKLFNL